MSQIDMNSAMQILLINHHSIAIVYNYGVQKLGVPVSKILLAHAPINHQFFLHFFFKITSDSLIGPAAICGVIGYHVTTTFQNY